MSPRVSGIVICRNEEEHIRECLQSLAWCDEIVVVDSGSTDRTVEIAREFTPKLLHRDWTGFIEQIRFALTQATGDWVLCIDADERCSGGLKEAIAKSLPEAGDTAGFELRRHTWYLGRWIDHGGWYPDWKVRFVKREGVRCEGHEPHYRLIPQGPVRRIDADILHFTYDDFKDHLRTADRYSDVVSDEWMKEGRGFNWLKAILHPPLKFFGCYILKLGILDGWPGFVIAVTSAFYVFCKYTKHREKLLKPRRPHSF
ncbi:MAG TPA: glycosyltransferase family 2 protein [Planctomycetota bacterium]|nr:glycosyltransferase family 2 protein [Planctomycetota bacterium]